MQIDLPPTDRDFRGHGDAPPARRWPNGKRLAVSLVVNFEEGAELSVESGDAVNESIYEAVEAVEGARDLCMESHFQYGTRVGWWRIRRELAAHRVIATLSACGRAALRSPWLVREAAADGHEIAAHGWRWERHAHMDEPTERATITRTVAAIARVAGAPPIGWHTRSATSVSTRRLLVEQGGFLYDSNAYDDDTPYVVEVAGRPHVVVPYAFDTNDMRFHNRGGFVHGDDFARYCIAAFDRLHAESGEMPRLLSVGLHLRIIGRPARIGGLARFLEHAASHSDVWFARRDQIAHAWREAVGLPAWAPAV